MPDPWGSSDVAWLPPLVLCPCPGPLASDKEGGETRSVPPPSSTHSCQLFYFKVCLRSIRIPLSIPYRSACQFPLIQLLIPLLQIPFSLLLQIQPQINFYTLHNSHNVYQPEPSCSPQRLRKAYLSALIVS